MYHAHSVEIVEITIPRDKQVSNNPTENGMEKKNMYELTS